MYILAFIYITINAIHAFHIFVLIVAAIDVMFTVSERGCGNCCGLSRACCSFPVCVLPSFTPALGAALCSRLHTVIRPGSTSGEEGSSSVFVCLFLLCGGESALTF